MYEDYGAFGASDIPTWSWMSINDPVSYADELVLAQPPPFAFKGRPEMKSFCKVHNVRPCPQTTLMISGQVLRNFVLPTVLRVQYLNKENDHRWRTAMAQLLVLSPGVFPSAIGSGYDFGIEITGVLTTSFYNGYCFTTATEQKAALTLEIGSEIFCFRVGKIRNYYPTSLDESEESSPVLRGMDGSKGIHE